MEFKKLALSVAISSALLLAGCGGDGSPEATSKTVTASGKAAKGIIVNGLVTAYELVGGEWVEVGSGMTDTAGQYQLTLSDYQGGPVRLEITADAGTQMKCDVSSCGEASFGDSIDVDESTFSLTAVLPEVEGNSISDVPITPYTHMAASRVVQKVNAGEAVDKDAVQEAIGEVNALVGFNVATTKVVDITDADSFDDASADEQRAAVLGAAVLNLASESKSVEEVLSELAVTFEDGSFDSTDAVSITSLTDSWTAALEDAQIAGKVENNVKTDIGLQVASVVLTTGEDGSYDPEASAHTGDTDVAKAKALINDTRSLVNNIADTDFESPMQVLGDGFDAAAEIFDKDAAAMVELAGVGIEQLLTALEEEDESLSEEGASLSDELEQEGSLSRTVTVALDGQPVGDLTLDVTTDGGLSLILSGELTGTEDGARTVMFDEFTLTSNVQLADLLAESTEQSTFTFAVSGGLTDGTTSMAISDGQLSVVFDEAPAAESEPVVNSLKLDKLTIELMANGASFTGGASLHLIKPDAGMVALPLYDDMPLTLDLVSLDGTFTNADGASLSAAISLDLVNADKFDLLAFLNQDDVVHVSMYDTLSPDDVTALQAKAQAAGANWHLEYGSYAYNDGQSYPFVWSSSDNGQFFFDEDYASLKQVFDPEAALQAEFGQIDATVNEARIYVDAEGNTALSGEVELGHMQETNDYFLQAKLNASFELTDLDGLPPVKVAAEIDRNQLNGGDASLLLSWDGEQYTIKLEQLDVENETGTLTVSNPEGVSLTLSDVSVDESDETMLAGALYVGDKKVADVTTLESGAVKVSYIDGTFETLQ